MVKLIIFDLDGVLVDAREIHYEALNQALYNIDPKFIITREEHLSTYDGLNTKKKLLMLTSEKALPIQFHNKIFEDKQKYTIDLIENMNEDWRLREVLRTLKEDDGYTIAVASNSIRQSLKMMLVRTGLIDYIDYYFSNEDVTNPKPSSEIYLQCMIKAGVSPVETLIVEDSPTGRQAAKNSGAHVMGVYSKNDVTLENLDMHLNKADGYTPVKWVDHKLNVLIPMAGKGSRFEQAGYTFPKPLIEVQGKPMIQMVVENLAIEAHYIFIVQKEHYDKYNLKTFLNLIAPGCDIIPIDYITEGAACTTLLAKSLINNDNPLIIANSDQYLEWNSSDFMWSMSSDSVDGGIITFKATHPKWSFAKVDSNGWVLEVAEKNPISNDASTGVYYYAKGSDYVEAAETMINSEERVNGEYYVCPVFNVMLHDGKKIKNYHIDHFYGTGTPEDLQTFLNSRK